MNSHSSATMRTHRLLCCVGLSTASLLGATGVSQGLAAVVTPPASLTLNGVVRDFTPAHPDFGMLNPADLGQYTGNVAPTLGPDGRPAYAGAGRKVTSQWLDKNNNPIMPYGDRGLFGGHFDVDVYDTAPSTSELYHEHQFDDTYNVTYVDIANDLNLLFGAVVGAGYPNQLRVSFLNPNNGGGGMYRFAAGGAVQTGRTANGFMTTFSPAQLTEFKINFMSLDAMRATQPGNSQGDAINRDGALSIRMYDVVTNALVYELAVYHHFKAGAVLPAPTPAVGNDACGVPLNDTVGSYGAVGSGAVTDAGTFDQWFRNDPTVNAAAPHGINLQRNALGIYEYMTPSFFPVDGGLFGNAGSLHNDFFTYSIAATFTYNMCTNMFFEFQGNDDVWVYIDGKLVIGISGAATPSRQYVALDRLNLVDGQDYTLEFFYAHRRQTPNSIFNMRTNIPLRTSVLGTPTSALYD